MNWYALKVSKGQDNKVKEGILNTLKINDLKDYVNEILVPTEKYIDVKGGKRITKERSLLSGYVIIQADLEKTHVINTILKVKHVLGFMGEKKNAPVKIPDSEIARLIGKMNNTDTSSLWMEGEKIKVISGPFNSFEGIIKKVDEAKQKVNVEVKIFGRATPLELEFDAIQKF